MQLDDGAWAITAATANQIAVYRHFGVPRILLANQLMGRSNIDFVLGELRRDPAFDFYCLVDSLEGLRLLEDAARRADIGRPLQLLLEVGAADGRTGVRNKAAALEVARTVARAAPYLALRGVEGYEGVFRDLGQKAHEERVLAYFEAMVEVLEACRRERLFAAGPILLTAGGSDFYDFAVRGLGRAALDEEIMLILRSGCYITQDSLHYDRAFTRILERSPELRDLAPPMSPALEIWGYLQSLPEPGLGFATLGKRDISHDYEMPKPLTYYRPGNSGLPLPIPEGHAVLRLNDQHAHLKLPPNSPLRVGDMVSFGVSHPCTTFDKWQLVLRVDDAYNVTGALRTFF
jgi:D-serine dehydratase